MRFVMSYSFGKDSTLALHRMISQGHTPVALLVMVNAELERSWFHGVDPALMQEIGQSLDIPLLLCPSDGEQYHLKLEEGLAQAAAMGAQACAFGDIDIEDNARWCRARCERTGLLSLFPLWQQSREDLTREVLELGYTAWIKCIRNDLLPKNMLGQCMNRDILREMQQLGVDVCGENGEYHTLITNGPIFGQPVNVHCGEVLDFGTISAVNITQANHQ